MRRLLLVLVLLLPGVARAADIVDATGRTVSIPEHVARILPAGPPAAVLLLALAPDLLLGLPMEVSPEARAWLSPEAAALPKVPRLTGKQDVTEQVAALQPDLIVDYGDVTPAYNELARKTQDRLGVPTILLDGALARTPEVLRLLGRALHREVRAEVLARLAEGVLALQVSADRRTVVYLRGAGDVRAVTQGVGASEVFARLGWTVLAPPDGGAFRPVTLAQVAAFGPDVLLFQDEKMRDAVAASDGWRALRAVRTGHARIAPAQPFGWVEEPPSLNRLLGLAWLGGQSADAVAASVGAVLYGHTPTAAQLDAVVAASRPLPP